ncbi:Alpha/Beta hydrolase protein [Aspergillus keveii]|uniref:Alpha/Beta hydrolase protein n=1 Tax=Aspergillus keveii TaxID=714993 RepID=A0ABR4GJL8_9EURO
MAIQRSQFAKHPFKFLFTTWFLAVLPFRLAGIVIYYLPSATRANRSWRQAVATKLLNLWFKFATAVEFRTPKSLNPGAEADRFVLIDPDKVVDITSSPSPYTGPLTTNPAIKPAKVAAFWYESPPPTDGTPPPLVVLHFHAGAYVLGGARTAMEAGWGPLALSKKLTCPVLMPEYRLSNKSDRSTSFPAALQDAVTAYTYLLHTLNIPARNIILSGDSAGGNLVVALLRYITESGEQTLLPNPRAALLWSPWADLTTPAGEIDAHRNVHSDFLFGGLRDWGVESYTPDGWDISSPYHSNISPAGHEFRTSVPIFIQTSKQEILYDSHVALARGMQDVGCSVELVEIETGPHDVFLGAELFGLLEDGNEIIGRANEFVLRHGDAQEGSQG